VSCKITQRKYNQELKVPYPGLQRFDVISLEILKLVRKGIMYKDIAKKFKIVKSTICYRLRRDFPQEYKQLRKNPSAIKHHADCAHAYKIFKELGSVKKTANQLGIPVGTIQGRIKFMKEILGE